MRIGFRSFGDDKVSIFNGFNFEKIDYLRLFNYSVNNLNKLNLI